MFGSKSYYYKTRRGLYSSSRTYGYSRRGTIGRAAAGAAAAKRSDKTETFSCTINGVCTTTLRANQQMSNIKVFHPYSGGLTQGIPNDQANLVHGGAVNDRMYRMKCASYDEMKLDTMKVTLSPAQLLTNNNITYTICTMWDRKASPKECGYVGAADWMQNGSMPTAMEIYNNEGTIKSMLTGNQIYGYKRYCRASSIIEKGGYHDSSILYDSTVEQSPLRIMYQNAWMRSALPFAPALFLTIYSPATVTADITIALTYKVEYTFTFRNPKSDLDWFLTVEAPGYVNPMGRELDGRSTSKSLQEEFNRIFEMKTARSLPLPEAIKSMETMFSPIKKKEDEDEDETMEVEDDPGTA